MTLGVFLSSGESKASFDKIGQLPRLEKYLETYRKHFENAYLFSYDHPFLHRYLWMFLMPFFRWQELSECNVYRVLQFPGVFPAVIGKLFFQKPILVTYGYRYDKFLALDSAWMQRGLLWMLERMSFPFIDRFLVTTDALGAYLLGKGIPPRRIVKIPNGVESSIFSPRSMRGKRIKTVLFVGRFERQKNLFTLIDAVSRVERKENIRLHFVGTGSLKTKLVEHARHLHVNLDIDDAIPHDQLSSVYQDADLFVLPSFHEGQPKVLLEAMSCGLPCIVSRFQGVEEIIDDGFNGIIVQPTVEDIHYAIQSLLQDPKKAKELGQQARKMIVRSFDLGRLLSKEVKVLKELAK